MWAAVRSRSLPLLSSSSKDSYPLIGRSWKLGFPGLNQNFTSSTVDSATNTGFLDLEEVEKVLTDVKADNVQVIPVNKGCDWADFMVLATGRSAWHVKNIAQALIYQAKQKQRGARRVVLPSVQGQEGGKWIVVDSGKIIVHALDEKARAYYNLESLWNTETSPKDSIQDLEKAFVKIRPKNNSKKPMRRNA